MTIHQSEVATSQEPGANPGEPRLVGSSPLISVCIANYNLSQFLAAAIESALGQTYPRVEVVVVDDGSTDDSPEVIERYGDRVCALSQPNSGQAAAGWKALQAAKGDAVIFLDADDLLDAEICRQVAAAFEREPSAAIVQWRLRTIDAEGRPLERVLPPRPGLLPSGDLSDHVLQVRNWHYQVASGTAYAAWAARKVLPARLPEGEYHALDQWLNELVPLLGPVCSLDEVGGARRIHSGNYSFAARGPAAWPRRMITLTLNSHEYVRRLAAELGRDCPEDARDLRDPAFLGWRLWSLTVEPERHPFPSDRRSTLALAGIVASFRHPHFPLRHRLKRAAWFAAVAALPRSLAERVVARYPSDGPISVRA